MKPIIKADDVLTIFKHGLQKTTTTTTTERLRRERDTAAASQDTQDKGKSPKN